MISDWVALQNYIYKRSFLSFFNYKKGIQNKLQFKPIKVSQSFG